MATMESNGGGGREEEHAHVVELAATAESDSDSDSDQIIPLLTHLDKPKINIFSVSYPRRKSSREQVAGLVETETSPFTQSIIWVWGGSRYSGLFCMALSSSIYCIMEVLLDVFSVQPIPLFEIAFTRCTIMAMLSFIWLRKSGQPVFGPTNVRKLLVSRALVGYVSLMSFVYCMQRLPLSQGIILSFTTPIMASVAARIILREKIKIPELGGLSCSFIGVLLIFRSMLTAQGIENVSCEKEYVFAWDSKRQGRMASAGKASDSNVEGSHQIYALVIGLLSSIAGGISYCLIRAGAKASDQPVVTVFSFGILASPAAAVCTFAFQDFVMPGLYSFFLMVVLGVLAFFAELFFARGLQLEKTSKVANIHYLEAALSQIWGMGSFRVIPSFRRIVGCLLILVSTCSTLFIIGPEKEVE